MERIYTLIDKLYQQKAQAAPPSHLLFTVQLLQQELSQFQNKAGSISNRKVAVTLPLNLNFSEEALRIPFAEATKEKEVFVLEASDEIEVEEVEVVAPVSRPSHYSLQKPAVAEVVYSEPKTVVREEPVSRYAPQEVYNSALEVVAEVPTLQQYSSRVEVHEAIAQKRESLNDRLKDEKKEVAHLLKESPIKDLRKGIGINDRFAFVKELFRGDEAAYERSIKTINGFNIYSEAEYWMTRELKYKLGWDEKNETVRHFYSLVRRRFA